MGDRTRERTRKAFSMIFRPGKTLQGMADKDEADQNRADAERFRQEGMDLAGQLNWEPDYVSDIMPDYQRAQSPVARAFLESMLTGTNPSSVASTRHGAGRLRAGAQAGFDQQFGGWDELLRQQREAEQATPWAPGKFSAPAVMPLGGVYAGPRVGGEVPTPERAQPGWGDVGKELDGEEMQRLRDRQFRRMTGA